MLKRDIAEIKKLPAAHKVLVLAFGLVGLLCSVGMGAEDVRVIGTVKVQPVAGSTFTVTGPLTDTQLRTTPVGVVIYGSTSATAGPTLIPLDGATNSIQTIEYEHHEIHGGSYFRAGTAQDVGNGGVINLCITTPDTTKWAHLRPTVECEAECVEIFYENPTSISGGTGVLPKNADRNSATVATSTCVFNATTNITGATTLGTRTIGAGKTFGGSASAEFEWVLKQNEQYILQVTNNTTGNNNIFIGFQWYEHTNKN